MDLIILYRLQSTLNLFYKYTYNSILYSLYYVYNITNYSGQANKAKTTFIENALTKVSEVKLAWDKGANDGRYSKIVSTKGIPVVAMDVDENAVNQHYNYLKQNPSNILPLIIDLGNPTASKGWALQERNSILDREKPDLVLALALIHHIVFSF